MIIIPPWAAIITLVPKRIKEGNFKRESPIKGAILRRAMAFSERTQLSYAEGQWNKGFKLTLLPSTNFLWGLHRANIIKARGQSCLSGADSRMEKGGKKGSGRANSVVRSALNTLC